MYHDRRDLIGQICSRICHDLISPLGAISNGLELLSMTGVEYGPELSLIEQSAQNAQSRIKFLRTAYGKAGKDVSHGSAEIQTIAADYFAGGRVAFDWSCTEPVTRRDAQLIFLGLACLENALAYGGTISVEKQGTGWRLRCEAEKILPNRAAWAELTGTADKAALEPSAIQFAYLRLLTEFRTPPLVVEISDRSITLSL